MSEEHDHLIESFKEFIGRAQKSIAAKRYYGALAHLNVAKRVMGEMKAAGIEVSAHDSELLEKMINDAEEKHDAQQQQASEGAIYSFNRLRQSSSKSTSDKKAKVMSIFLFGLDAAGKTTFVDYVKNERFIDPSPTVGVNITRITLGTLKFVFNDVGGQEKFREKWMDYWKNPDVMIFMVDSTDAARFDQAKEGFYSVLNDEVTGPVPLLIVSNKIDLQNSKPLREVLRALDAQTITGKTVGTFEISVKEKINIHKVLNFLASQALADTDFREFVGNEVDKLNESYGELYKVYINEAQMLEKDHKYDKALDRYYKSKIIQEELFKQGYSKAHKEITKCNVQITRLKKLVGYNE